jgi:hypothetical protein
VSPQRAKTGNNLSVLEGAQGSPLNTFTLCSGKRTGRRIYGGTKGMLLQFCLTVLRLTLQLVDVSLQSPENDDTFVVG